MHNNYFFLRKLAGELNALLSGSELVTCFSQDKGEVVMGFSGDIYLKCILKPDFSGLTLIHDFSRARKNSVSLWEELYGEKVREISVFDNERAVKIRLGQNYLLVIKLFGNRPNLLVYKNNESIAVFNHRLLTDKALKPADFNRILNADYETFVQLQGNHRKQFFTFGKELSEEIDRQGEGLSISEKWEKIHLLRTYLEEPRFYVNTRQLKPRLSLLEGDEKPDAISAVNTFVSLYQRITAVERLQSETKSKLLKDIAKTQNYISTTRNKLNLWVSGTRNEEIGNILMAHLHQVKEGSTEVELENFYTGKPILIQLKKELSVQKNAESYYRKSKNEKIEIETAERNLKAAEHKLHQLGETLLEVENARDIRQLRGILKEQAAISGSDRKEDLPFREYLFKGTKIWVGKNARNNDLLLTKYAHKDDWWLHARDTTGSHVVVKNPHPSKELLEFAASLAAWYSKRRSEKLVTVIYTPRKYVRKGRNLAAGQVIVEKETTLLAEPKNG